MPAGRHRYLCLVSTARHAFLRSRARATGVEAELDRLRRPRDDVSRDLQRRILPCAASRCARAIPPRQSREAEDAAVASMAIAAVARASCGVGDEICRAVAGLAVAVASSGAARTDVTVADVVTLARTHAGAAVNRTWTLPIAVVYPTGRCNSRCVSCSWWATTGDGEMTAEEFADLAGSLEALGTRLAVFSGGEPLLREDLWTIARAFRHKGIVLHLLTS